MVVCTRGDPSGRYGEASHVHSLCLKNGSTRGRPQTGSRGCRGANPGGPAWRPGDCAFNSDTEATRDFESKGDIWDPPCSGRVCVGSARQRTEGEVTKWLRGCPGNPGKGRRRLGHGGGGGGWCTGPGSAWTAEPTRLIHGLKSLNRQRKTRENKGLGSRSHHPGLPLTETGRRWESQLWGRKRGAGCVRSDAHWTLKPRGRDAAWCSGALHTEIVETQPRV